MTPAEILDTFPALTVGQVAVVLNKYHRNGEPNRVVVRELIRAGKLPLVDADEPVTRWTVPAHAVRAYLGVAA